MVVLTIVTLMENAYVIKKPGNASAGTAGRERPATWHARPSAWTEWTTTKVTEKATRAVLFFTLLLITTW